MEIIQAETVEKDYTFLFTNNYKQAVQGTLASQTAYEIQSLKSYTKEVQPKFIFYPHCNLLAEVLEKVVSGEIKRLMISLPPRHSKSELVSRIFSSYYLMRHPSRFVGINSYSAELAYTLSRASRELFGRGGGIVKDDVAAVKHWETPQGGGVWAAGVGGSITGKGFHLGIIDDPIKNAEEAASEIIREKHKEWYGSTFYTRAEPGAAIIVIQTRWFEDDLSGYLLSEETGETPEGWTIVNLPALYEGEIEAPESCNVIPDFRTEEGEALCPERYDEQQLAKIRSRIGDYHFGALYQQRPTSKTGSFFDVTQFEIVDALPLMRRTGRGWDKAATSDGGDYTAGVKMSVYDGTYYIEDVKHGQWATAARDRVIRQTAETDGERVFQLGEQEPGSSGKDSAVQFIKLLSGFPVSVKPASGSKVVRADPYSSQVNAGNVKLLRGEWNKAFIEEHRMFPRGKHDDRVDAASLVFSALATVSALERPTTAAPYSSFDLE